MGEESGVDRFMKNVVSPYSSHSDWPSFRAELKSHLTPYLKQPRESCVFSHIDTAWKARLRCLVSHIVTIPRKLLP